MPPPADLPAPSCSAAPSTTSGAGSASTRRRSCCPQGWGSFSTGRGASSLKNRDRPRFFRKNVVCPCLLEGEGVGEVSHVGPHAGQRLEAEAPLDELQHRGGVVDRLVDEAALRERRHD